MKMSGKPLRNSLKFRFPTDRVPLARVVRASLGVTLVETLITALVLGIFVAVISIVYRNSMRTYTLTNWKQQKTQQAQHFWASLRKPLEEATDGLSFGLPPDYQLTKLLRPLKFRPGRFLGEGNVLAWQVDSITYSSGSGPSVTGPKTYIVTKLQSGLLANGPDLPSLRLTDVESIEVKIIDICQQPVEPFAEYLCQTSPPPDPIVGAIVEIAIVFRPNPALNLPDVKQAHNAKFKVNVQAVADPSPAY